MTQPVCQITARRRKVPHDLYPSTSLADLNERLARRGIELVSLVKEFVRPTAEVGALVRGSLADGVATPVSDLDVLMLMSDATAIKRRPREICGNPVVLLPPTERSETRFELFIDGLEIDLEIVVKRGPHVPTGLWSEWIVCGNEVVAQWKAHYGIPRWHVTNAIEYFTHAAKLLEDVEVGIGMAPGYVAMLGVDIAKSSLRSLLFHHGRNGASLKWMRMLAQLEAECDRETRDTVGAGRRLLFPGMLHSEQDERTHFERVQAFLKATRRLLARDGTLEDALQTISHELDLMV